MCMSGGHGRELGGIILSVSFPVDKHNGTWYSEKRTVISMTSKRGGEGGNGRVSSRGAP